MWEALGIRDFQVFLISATMLALTPGQDTLYVVGRTLAQGRAAGIASVIGILSGALIHLLAGALGLSALLIASPSAFAVVRWAGGAYLIYLGIRMLCAGGGGNEIPETFKATGTLAVWRQGMLTNLLNPKVALFCLAFIPQFIQAEAPRKTAAFLLLGLCFFVIGTAWLFCIVGFASGIGGKLRHDPRFAKTLNRTAGVLFMVLGLRLVLQR